MDMLTDDKNLSFDLAFEPDVDAEEELAGEEKDEFVDPALITDVEIRKCRILATIRCIEYGVVAVGPGTTAPAALLCIDFTFHSLKARVKEAVVELAPNKATVAVLRPESVDDDETTETVRKKLSGEIKIGYEPAGVEGTLAAERESEREKKSERRIRGSGAHTTRAVWTLHENSENKKGIHLAFVGMLIARFQGGGAAAAGFEVDLEIRAKLGPSFGNGLGIRRILTRASKRFDGKTLLGFRPVTLDISKGLFVANSAKATQEEIKAKPNSTLGASGKDRTPAIDGWKSKAEMPVREEVPAQEATSGKDERAYQDTKTSFGKVKELG